MPAAQLGTVDQVVVDERGGVHELDRHRGAHELLLARPRGRRAPGGLGGEQHEQRAQALAPATIVALACEASGAPASAVTRSRWRSVRPISRRKPAPP